MKYSRPWLAIGLTLALTLVVPPAHAQRTSRSHGPTSTPNATATTAAQQTAAAQPTANATATATTLTGYTATLTNTPTVTTTTTLTNTSTVTTTTTLTNAPTATNTPTSTPTATPTRTPTNTVGSHILFDANATNGYSGMPTQHGALYVHDGGYEMFDAKTNPEVVRAHPPTLRPLATYAVQADLTSVSGPDTAPYGIDLLAGPAEYAFEIRPDGTYSVQQLVSGGHRIPLRDRTTNGQIKTGHGVANEISAVYAGGLLELFINGAEVGWVTVPHSPQSTSLGLINEGSTTADVQVRCTHFQVRAGPVVVVDDHFRDNTSAWHIAPGKDLTAFLAAGVYSLRNSSTHNAAVYAFPGIAAPSSSFTVSADLTKIGGGDEEKEVFGLHLYTPSVQYVFGIDGAGKYVLFIWQGHWIARVPWTPLAIIRKGNARNELFLHYAHGTLTLGINHTIILSLTLAQPPVLGQVGLEVNPGLLIHCTHFLLTQPPDALDGRDPLQPAPKLRVRTVVLRDSFADDYNDWYTGPQDFLKDHAYHIRNTAPGMSYRGWAQSLQLGDAYSFAATIQLIAGADLTYGYGLDFLDHTGSAKFWELYIFQISNNGYYSLWRGHTGSWVPVIPWTRTDLVAWYATNRLRVDVLHTAVSLYLNGQHLADARLPDVLPGPSTVGFVVNSKMHIAVRQAQVTALIGGNVPLEIKPPRPVAPQRVSAPVHVALQQARPAVVHILVTSDNNAGGAASGTGFLILSDATGAYILTAEHVVRNVNSMTVKNRVTIVLQNGHSLQPMDMVAGTPDQGDVAVIKVRPQRGMQGAVEKFLPTSGVQVGDVAWAIGYYGNATSPGSLGSSIVPLGGNNTDAPITQPGEVSNLAFPIDGISYLTTNATLGEGMSGGPLVFVGTGDKPDWLGCVIGIDDAYVLPFGPHAQFPNLNLVLPSDSVLPLVKQLLGGFDPRPVGSVGSC